MGQADQLTPLEGGFVSEDSGQGDICGLDGIGVALALSSEQLNELVNEMGMGTTVTGALSETEVFLSILV